MKSLYRSFAGGEIAEEMRGRVDLTAYQTGLARAENVITLPHGPAEGRPGFMYGGETKAAITTVGAPPGGLRVTEGGLVRVIPFVFSNEQSLVLEFGNAYIRFIADNAHVMVSAGSALAITASVPARVTIPSASVAAFMTVRLSGVVGPSELNAQPFLASNVVGNQFDLVHLDGTPVDTSASPPYTPSSGTVGYVYEIASPYASADLAELNYTQSNDVLTLVHPRYQQRELRRLGPTNWALAPLVFAPTIAAPAFAPTVVATVGTGSEVYHYVTTALAADTLEESLASPAASVTNNLATAGNFNTITPSLVAGAVRYNVYRRVSGLFGYIGQTDGSGFQDRNIAPDLTQTPPNADDPFVGANNYPSAVGYFRGRRWFGGTLNRGLGLWATRSGTESNFSYSIPTQDDDRISIRVNARRASRILHIVPMDELFLLTASGEWVVRSANSDVMSGTSIDPRMQGSIGSSVTVPVTTNVSVIYAQSRGGRVRELMYSDARAAFNANDISVMAPHLFDGFTVTSMAFAPGPYPTVWCTRSDGALLGLTYMPEQKVAGWHQHNTDGTFESLCSIPEGGEDTVYVIVRRVVNGRSMRTFERMAPRRPHGTTTPVGWVQRSAFYVDSGLSGTSTSDVTVIRGLRHLEGKTVAVLGNGAVYPQRVVQGGSITLPDPILGTVENPAVFHVGLPYVQRMDLLPPTGEVEAAGQAMTANVREVFLRLVRSGALKVSAGGPLRELATRTNEPWGSPPSLVTGVFRVTPEGDWHEDLRIAIVQEDPLPLSVSAMTIDVEPGA